MKPALAPFVVDESVPAAALPEHGQPGSPAHCVNPGGRGNTSAFNTRFSGILHFLQHARRLNSAAI